MTVSSSSGYSVEWYDVVMAWFEASSWHLPGRLRKMTQNFSC